MWELNKEGSNREDDVREEIGGRVKEVFAVLKELICSRKCTFVLGWRVMEEEE